jgi:8-oxo-dGTP pyrophosphatase MutT (NUDIX family)
MIDTIHYPDLFAPPNWGIPVVARFELLREAPPQNLISNVNVVPFVGDKCVIIHVASGYWEIPGGTLEPDEPHLDGVRRELLEEVGAKLLSFRPIGAWNCQSQTVQPYRPHLPHPHFYRLVGYGDVELVGAPLNPADGEQVTQVDVVTVEEAANRFHSIGRGDLADLYRLAAYLRSNRDHANLR